MQLRYGTNDHTMILLTNIFLFFCAIISTLTYFILLEKYTKNIQPEHARRLSHIGGSFAAIIFNYIVPQNIFALILISFIAIMIISKKAKFFPHIHNVKRNTFGEELLPLGFLFALFITNGNPYLFMICILIIGIADPLTGAIMQLYNNNLFGFVVFFSVTFFILSFSNMTIYQGLFSSIIIALTERMFSYGTDNLTVPIVTGILLMFFT